MSISLNRTLATAAAAFAVLAAACSGSDVTALATVNGTEIGIDDMRDLRVSYGGEDVETNTEQFRVDLTRLIFSRALLDAAAAPDYGVTITDADIAERLSNPPPRYAFGFAGIQADPDLGEGALRLQATLSLIEDRVTTQLLRADEGYLAGLLQDRPEQLVSACVRHILVDNIFEAESIIDQLNGGADFAALASEFSTDTSNAETGGLLAESPDNCLVPLSRWLPAFGNAAAIGEVGAILGPVATDFGYHVIRVDERTEMPSREELEADPLAYVGDVEYSRLFTPWWNEKVRAAEISVNSLVGNWFSEGLGIIPPDG